MLPHIEPRIGSLGSTYIQLFPNEPYKPSNTARQTPTRRLSEDEKTTLVVLAYGCFQKLGGPV